MQTLVWLLILSSIAWWVGFGVYFAIVDLGMIYTNKYLTISDVPFYKSNVFWPHLADLYNFNFFVMVTDIILMLLPFPAFLVIILSFINDKPKGDRKAFWGMITWYGLLGLLQILKTVWNLIQFGLCDKMGQQCRPYDGSTGSFVNTNSQFLGMVVFNAVAIVPIIVFLLLSYNIPEEYAAHRQARIFEGDAIFKSDLLMMLEVVQQEHPERLKAVQSGKKSKHQAEVSPLSGGEESSFFKESRLLLHRGSAKLKQDVKAAVPTLEKYITETPQIPFKIVTNRSKQK